MARDPLARKVDSVLPQPDARADFSGLFRRHVGFVCRTLRALGVSPALVEDACQDVFVTVHRRLEEFEGRSKLETWIYSVTYRTAQNYRRRHQRHEIHQRWDDDRSAGQPDPSDTYADREAAQFVLRFLDTLPTEHRDVFVLCVIEGLSAPDAAALLEVKLNTVYSRLRSARERFRRAIRAASDPTTVKLAGRHEETQ